MKNVDRSKRADGCQMLTAIYVVALFYKLETGVPLIEDMKYRASIALSNSKGVLG